MDIHELIGRELRDEASNEDLAAIESWKSKDKFNTKLHAQYHSIWQSTVNLRPETKIRPIADWSQFLQSQATSQNSNYLKWMSLAASFLILGILIRFVFLSSGTVYEANPDQVASFMLEDGSTVWLNKNAKIRYEQEDGLRLVDLEGEAFFEVAHDPGAPFIISTDDLKTQVIGTAFNVDHTGEKTVVTVESGKVEVYDQSKQSILLTRGMAASYDLKTEKLTEKVEGNRNAYSWKTGILSFENAPIREVIVDLEQHFENSLSIENTQSDAHLTATFDNQSLEAILGLIEIITDEKVYITQ